MGKPEAKPEEWKRSNAILVAKIRNAKAFGDFREIILQSTLLKTYMRCLAQGVDRSLREWRNRGVVGGTKGHSAASAQTWASVLCEKASRWSIGAVLVELDVKRAFATLDVMKACETLVWLNCDPLTAQALAFETYAHQYTTTLGGIVLPPVVFERGTAEGGAHSALLLRAISIWVIEN